MLNDTERKVLLELATAGEANFVELAQIAGLDPRTSFQGADLRGVDFSGCDLRGFDFTDADLSGASFKGASLKGAVFSDAAQPFSDVEPIRTTTATSARRQLNATQRHVLQMMLKALDERGRALALMPLGTGRSRVLSELIASSLPPGGRAALIVTSAAEREQMTAMLRTDLAPHRVMTTKEAREIQNWTGVVVHSASAYENNFDSLLQVTFGNLDLIFFTSLERFQRWLRATEADPSFVRAAVFDTPLLAIDRKDADRQATLVHKLFGEPVVEIDLEHALKSGQLIQAHIVQPFVRAPLPPKRHFFSAVGQPSLDQQLQMLEPIVKELGDIIEVMTPASLLVLCADAQQSRMVEFLLNNQRPGGPLGVRRAPQRWSADKIVDDLKQNPSILVTGLSRQAIDAARRTGTIAVLTPMRLSLAQELAFRPPLQRRVASVPTIIDLAGAFDGFPNVDQVMQV